jgi:hypothetical protein
MRGPYTDVISMGSVSLSFAGTVRPQKMLSGASAESYSAIVHRKMKGSDRIVGKRFLQRQSVDEFLVSSGEVIAVDGRGVWGEMDPPVFH